MKENHIKDDWEIAGMSLWLLLVVCWVCGFIRAPWWLIFSPFLIALAIWVIVVVSVLITAIVYAIKK